jgi:hypothetical protein
MEHRTFDVAKWSTWDIELKITEMEIEVNEKDLPEFIDAVIDVLDMRFDACYGINWDTIEMAIEDVNNGNT